MDGGGVHAAAKYTKQALAVVTPDGQHGVVAVDGDRPGLVFGSIDLLMIFGMALFAGRTWRMSRVSPGGKPPTTT